MARKGPAAGAGVSGPEALSAAIRQRIIRREYQPGQRLTEEGLAEEFGVSRIPVREALRLLAADGFLRVQPYWGTFVAELTPEDADDLVEVRMVLEPLAARRAARHRKPEQLAELKQLLVEGRKAAREGKLDEDGALNGRFHELIAQASGNAALAGFIGQLRDKIDWAYSVEEHPKRRGWADHGAIVNAIEAGDEDLAAETVRLHIEQTASAYRFRHGPSPQGPTPQLAIPQEPIPQLAIPQLPTLQEPIPQLPTPQEPIPEVHRSARRARRAPR